MRTAQHHARARSELRGGSRRADRGKDGYGENKSDATGALPLDGSAPSVLHAYGGFEVSMTPAYNSTAGAAWIERGGV